MTAWTLSKHCPRLIPSIHALYRWCGFKFASTRLLAVMPWPPFHLQFASGKSRKCQNALTYHWSTQISSPQTEAKSSQDAQSFLLDEVNLCARPKGQTELAHRSFSASSHFMDFSFHWVRNLSWQVRTLGKAQFALFCSMLFLSLFSITLQNDWFLLGNLPALTKSIFHTRFQSPKSLFENVLDYLCHILLYKNRNM